jgi:hypothetical protein
MLLVGAGGVRECPGLFVVASGRGDAGQSDLWFVDHQAARPRGTRVEQGGCSSNADCAASKLLLKECREALVADHHELDPGVFAGPRRTDRFSDRPGGGAAGGGGGVETELTRTFSAVSLHAAAAGVLLVSPL